MKPDPFAGTWRLTGWVRLLGAALLLPVEMRAATRVRTVSQPTLPPALAVLADESAEVLYRPAELLPTPQEPRRLTTSDTASNGDSQPAQRSEAPEGQPPNAAPAAARNTTNLPGPPTTVVTCPADTAPKDQRALTPNA